MWLLMLEAGAALCLLVFIVWWTMYSGARPGRHGTEQAQQPEPRDQAEGPERIER